MKKKVHFLKKGSGHCATCQVNGHWKNEWPSKGTAQDSRSVRKTPSEGRVEKKCEIGGEEPAELEDWPIVVTGNVPIGGQEEYR